MLVCDVNFGVKMERITIMEHQVSIIWDVKVIVLHYEGSPEQRYIV